MVSIGLAIWGVIGEPYAFSMVALALAPVGALFSARFFAGGTQLTAPSYETPGIGNLLVLPPLVLAARSMLDFAMLDVAPLFAVGAVVGAIFLLATLWVTGERPSWSVMLLFAIVSLTYGASVAVMANALIRPTKPEFFRAQVMDGERWRESDPTYYLILAEPLYPGVPRRIEVGREFFAANPKGAEVCVQIYRGVFGWRWWALDFCPS